MCLSETDCQRVFTVSITVSICDSSSVNAFCSIMTFLISFKAFSALLFGLLNWKGCPLELMGEVEILPTIIWLFQLCQWLAQKKESVLKCYQKVCIYMWWHFQPYQWKVCHSGSNDTQVCHGQVVFSFVPGQPCSTSYQTKNDITFNEMSLQYSYKKWFYFLFRILLYERQGVQLGLQHHLIIYCYKI